MQVNKSPIQNCQELIESEGIKTSYFQSTEQIDMLRCFHSSSDKYKADKDYSIFEIASLTRILAQRSGVISPKLRLDIAKDSRSEICYILDWNQKHKKIIIFQFTDISKCTEKNLNLIFNDKKALDTDYIDRQVQDE